MSDSIFNNVTINNAGGDPINLKVGSTAARVTFDNTSTGLSGTELQTAIQQVLGQNGYAVCDTAGATAAKTATISNFVLRTGAKAVITFENENTAANPTLNISNTGAKAITVNSAAVGDGVIEAGYVFLVNYNGTSYDIVGGVGGEDVYFIGTSAEWEALTTTEKAEYDGKLVFITNDSIGTISAHIITNSLGTEFNQRSELKFINATITDDSVNNATVVTIPEVPVATTSVAGKTKPDGTTITIDNDGTIHSSGGSSRPVPTAYTIYASGWNSQGVYSFEADYPHSQYNITEIMTNENTSTAQKKAWNNCGCNGYYTTNIIKASGIVPTIDIPVTLFIEEI